MGKKNSLQFHYEKRGKRKDIDLTGIFKVSKEGSLWLVTSSNSNPKRYPDKLRVVRSCAFDRDGWPVSVGLPKFFDSSKDTAYRSRLDEVIRDGELYQPIAKYDGSLIVRSVVKNKVLFRTRNDIHNDISLEAEALAVKVLNDTSVYPKHSLQFEYVTPNRELVVPHSKPELVLIGAAENKTLDTLSYNEVVSIGEELGIRVAEEMKFEATDIDELEEQVRQATDIEGVVVRFDGDKMIRIKTDYYRNRRYEKTGIRS